MVHRFPVAIYRPGFITGHIRTSACKADGWIHYCTEMGYYPLLPNQRKKFIPVDYNNAAILHIAALLAGSSSSDAYHIMPSNRAVSVEMDSNMELVGKALGGSGSAEDSPYPEWVDLLDQNVRRRLQPLRWMLTEKAHGDLSWWELYEIMLLYDTVKTARALESYPEAFSFSCGMGP